MMKRLAIILACVLGLLLFLWCQFSGEVEFIDEAYVQKYEIDTYEFIRKIRNCEEERVLLSEMIPVEWDRIYTFFGYAQSEDIYEKVGYKWRKKIFEQNDEFDSLLVFMQGDVVVYDIASPRIGVRVYKGNSGNIVYATDAPEIQIIKSEEVIKVILCPE